jgi:predicted kinase
MSQTTLIKPTLTFEDFQNIPFQQTPEKALEMVAKSLFKLISILNKTPQDPIFHAEGDVWTHTQMVVHALMKGSYWAQASHTTKIILFWGSIFHDSGKPAVTKTDETGKITSHGHSRAGATIAREWLYYAKVSRDVRESICSLITYHQSPFWLFERENSSKEAHKISLTTRPLDLFALAEADALGRICPDIKNLFDKLALSKLVFEDNDILEAPKLFPNDESRVQYFSTEERWVDFQAHPSQGSRVTIMSGLPGAGKDTWLKNNSPHLPVISLDKIRHTLGINPSQNQGKAIQEARELARQYLREGTDFAWNATNLTQKVRTPLLSLLYNYDAHTTCVYLEPTYDVLLHQNNNRKSAIPKEALLKMIRFFEPPTLKDFHKIHTN